MRNNDSYFDFSDRGRGRDCDDDFDFCEDDCEIGHYDNNGRGRDYDRYNNEDYDNYRRGREGECECEDRRWNEERCKCREDENRCGCREDEGRCGCHEENHCRCNDDQDDYYGYDNECCERTPRCSDRKDFNEDERCGCNSRCDAAQSDDSWFDCQEEECCTTRCRQLCDEEKCFCKKLKCRIQILDFALQEVILFLDTHPCDYEALRYYRIIRRKLARLERLYECKCGPLTNQGVDTEFGWEWACCPWPWEGKE